MKKKSGRHIVYDFLQGYLMLHILWLIAHYLLQTKVIPHPMEVYKLLPSIATSKVLLHIGYSLYRILVGVVLSLVIGVPIGIGMSQSKIINKILYPFIYFTYPIPKTALLPIAMLLLGMRDNSKIAIIFLIIVFQVIVAVRDGVNGIDKTMYHVTNSLGGTTWDKIWHVILPGILPDIITSVRISIGTAVSILFFVEGYGTKYGMGYYIVDAWSRIQYKEMYLGILIISIIGFLLFALMDLLYHRLCTWDR